MSLVVSLSAKVLLLNPAISKLHQGAKRILHDSQVIAREWIGGVEGEEVFINERVSEGGVKAISAGAEIASNISARLRP